MIETSQDWRVLWLQVVRRAQEEADGMYSYWDEEPEVTKSNAIEWLTVDSEDLREVCDMAGFSPEMTQRLLQDMKGKYLNGERV